MRRPAIATRSTLAGSTPHSGPDEVIVVGGGALGVTLAAMFLRRGLRLAIVRRCSALGRSPPVQGVRGALGSVRLPASVWATELPAHSPRRPLLIVLATKSYDIPGAAPVLRSLVRPQDFVLMTQNGIDVEETLSGVLPRDQVGRLILDAGVVREGPTVRVTYARGGSIVPLDPSASRWSARVASHLRGAGLAVRHTGNLDRAVWLKSITGAMSVVCTLFDLPIGAASALPAAASLYEGLANERFQVARALGVGLSRATLGACAISNASAAAHLPSMLVDRRHGRPLEIRFDVERVLSLAARHRLEVPAHRAAAKRLRRLMPKGRA